MSSILTRTIDIADPKDAAAVEAAHTALNEAVQLSTGAISVTVGFASGFTAVRKHGPRKPKTGGDGSAAPPKARKK